MKCDYQVSLKWVVIFNKWPQSLLNKAFEGDSKGYKSNEANK